MTSVCLSGCATRAVKLPRTTFNGHATRCIETARCCCRVSGLITNVFFKICLELESNSRLCGSMRYARGEGGFKTVSRRWKRDRQFARLGATQNVVDDGCDLAECPFLAALRFSALRECLRSGILRPKLWVIRNGSSMYRGQIKSAFSIMEPTQTLQTKLPISREGMVVGSGLARRVKDFG